MMTLRWMGLGSLLLAAGALAAQQPAAGGKKPDPAVLKRIDEKLKALTKSVEQLRRKGVPDDLLADVEVFTKAVAWTVKHDEWHHADAPQWALDALEEGVDRATQLEARDFDWLKKSGRIIRGYRSEVDGSVQPYAVIVPTEYGKDPTEQWRLDLVLHGRDNTLTELKFIHQNGPKQEVPDQDFVQLNVYGRGNNAYRWAGEQDVFEALRAFMGIDAQVRQRNFIDRRRIVLRGFSMGGAGAWHLGLHHPASWCSVSPGAGFATTRGYVKNLAEPLPAYQEACLHIYDAVDYAENAANVPVVAYAGENDPQLAAARAVEAKLKPLGIPMTLIVGPATGHKYHPDSLKEILRLQAEHAAKKRPDYPPRVHFVTYTPLYATSFWVTVAAQVKQYERSLVEAEKAEGGYKVKTENVRLLELALPPDAQFPDSYTVDIDGQHLTVSSFGRPGRPNALVLERTDAGWVPSMSRKHVTDALRRMQKNSSLVGPIDAAFMGGFLCVRGTGKPWHPEVARYAEADLKRFQHEWSKYFRGELPVKNDVDVNSDDFDTKNLILFGDPGSNGILRLALDRLPLQWDERRLAFAGKEYDASSHLPILIYPSPFRPSSYVVVNSGHTFHAADFEGTNALLFPRLGDYAVLQVSPGRADPLDAKVMDAGLFDGFWQVPGRPATHRP